jgi:hypothetical protein
LILTQGVGDVVMLKIPTNTNVAFDIGPEPVSFTYGTTNFRGSNGGANIIVQDAIIGSFTFNGHVLNITSRAKSGFSKIFSFTKADKTSLYYQLEFDSGILPTNVLPAQTISFPRNIAVAGDANGQVFPTATASQILGINKVRVSLQGIQVLQFPLITPYNFYVFLTDGTFSNYVVNFKTWNIFVADITVFPVSGFLPTGQIPLFAEIGINVVEGNVINNNSLGEITMISPINAKITINRL